MIIGGVIYEVAVSGDAFNGNICDFLKLHGVFEIIAQMKNHVYFIFLGGSVKRLLKCAYAPVRIRNH